MKHSQTLIAIIAGSLTATSLASTFKSELHKESNLKYLYYTDSPFVIEVCEKSEDCHYNYLLPEFIVDILTQKIPSQGRDFRE